MRQIMEINKSFGGLSVIIMGEFYHLPPVKPPEILFSALLRHHEDKMNPNSTHSASGPRTNGAQLFNEFQLKHLEQQTRAADSMTANAIHMHFLNQIRNPTINKSKISLELLFHAPPRKIF